MSTTDPSAPGSSWPAVMTALPRFEILPLPGIADRVADAFPPGTQVTVTASVARGLDATVEIAVRLSRRGYRAIPHLAARMIASETHAHEIAARLADAGVYEVFVIAGDAPRQAGPMHGALDLLRCLSGGPHRFSIGVGAYPEGHPFLSSGDETALLREKSEHAARIVSQMCFDPLAVARWASHLREAGIDLPVHVGVPGTVSVARLLRVGAKVGVGQSLRMLTHHGAGMRQLVSPRWNPDTLLTGLAPAFADPALGLAGLHLYTFNAVDATAAWWATHDA